MALLWSMMLLHNLPSRTSLIFGLERYPLYYFQVEKYGQENVVIAVAGNKSDQTQGKFDIEQVDQYCTSKGYQHLGVSAKTGDNVEELFKKLSESLTKVHPKVDKKQTPQNEVVAKVMQKKNQFKLKSGKTEKTPQKKKCC